jgi:hypothetical protein
LLIVLGIVVVVVVIIGFTTGFDFIFGKVEQLPGQSLEAAVQACMLAANNELKADYCIEFRKVEISGQEQFVTCESLRELQSGLFESTTKVVSCVGAQPDAPAYCKSQNLKKDTIVKGMKCTGEYTKEPYAVTA